MKPLITFLDYQLLGLSLAPVESFRRGETQHASITTTFAVARTEEPRRFTIGMGCRLFSDSEKANIPYTTEFAVNGEFWSTVPLEEKVPATIVINALMLLYGTVRGLIAHVTAAGINGKFILPAVTFDELVKSAAADPDTGVSAHEIQLPGETEARM